MTVTSFNMHEPDQRSAFERRAQVTSPGGVVLLQYHSIVTIVGQSQWNALRHGHFAYYSLTTLTRLLGAVGMTTATGRTADTNSGTDRRTPNSSVSESLSASREKLGTDT